MADSKNEQIFDGGQAAVCQDGIKPVGCIAPVSDSVCPFRQQSHN